MDVSGTKKLLKKKSSISSKTYNHDILSVVLVREFDNSSLLINLK